jgi:hypothetical protein
MPYVIGEVRNTMIQLVKLLKIQKLSFNTNLADLCGPLTQRMQAALQKSKL